MAVWWTKYRSRLGSHGLASLSCSHLPHICLEFIIQKGTLVSPSVNHPPFMVCISPTSGSWVHEEPTSSRITWTCWSLSSSVSSAPSLSYMTSHVCFPYRSSGLQLLQVLGNKCKRNKVIWWCWLWQMDCHGYKIQDNAIKACLNLSLNITHNFIFFASIKMITVDRS